MVILIGFILLFFLLYAETINYFKAMCYSAVGTCLFLYVVTEVLSLFNNMARTSLSLAWFIYDISILVLFFGKMLKCHFWKNIFEVKNIRNKTSLFSVLCVGLFAAFIVMMISLAYKIVPYNWDSMVYHLPRIVYWAENKSIAHFAVSDTRLLGSPVLAEFVNLNVYILADGNDSYFNMLQCCSFLVNAILIYAISRRIGCSKGFALFALILFISTPIAFAESVTTQVDEFATLWLLIFVYLVLNYIIVEKLPCLSLRGIVDFIVIALCAAFGYLSKPTVIIAMILFSLWMLIVCVRRKEKIKKIIIYYLLTISISLFVISPEIIRNLISFNFISDPWQGKGQLIYTSDLRYILISFLKNLFFNLPSKYWTNLSSLLSDIVYSLAYRMGINPNAETISECGKEFVLSIPGTLDCDGAISPIPVASMLFCIVLSLATVVKKKKIKAFNGYTTTSFISFFVMCAIIRWEPWIGRYLIAYLALLCPAIAFQISLISGCEKKDKIKGFICGILFTMCITTLTDLVKNTSAIAIQMESSSRDNNYYYVNSSAYEEYKCLLDYLDNDKYKSVGISVQNNYLYPIINRLFNKGVSFKNVNIQNSTSKYEDMTYAPDIILVIDNKLDSDEYMCHGYCYLVKYTIDDDSYILEKSI